MVNEPSAINTSVQWSRRFNICWEQQFHFILSMSQYIARGSQFTFYQNMSCPLTNVYNYYVYGLYDHDQTK